MTTTQRAITVDMGDDAWAREMRVTYVDRTFWHCAEVSQLGAYSPRLALPLAGFVCQGTVSGSLPVTPSL
jgi:hypothetical protein